MAEIATPSIRFAFPFQSAHYKWCATRLPTVERRLAMPGVSPAGREYGGKLRDYLARHGRIRLEDVALLRRRAEAALARAQAPELLEVRGAPRRPSASLAPGSAVQAKVQEKGAGGSQRSLEPRGLPKH